jgi:hypothetical protein
MIMEEKFEDKNYKNAKRKGGKVMNKRRNISDSLGLKGM